MSKSAKLTRWVTFTLSVFMGLGSAGSIWAETAQSADEPTVFLCGIWPDRILLFDQEKDEFADAFRLRHGVVSASSHTWDMQKFFLVTDRMETVEIVNPWRREILDEVKLSEPGLRVRIAGVFPSHDGTKLYMTVSPVRLEPDRFIREDGYDVVVYDLDAKSIEGKFSLPEDAAGRWRSLLHASPDGRFLYVVGTDIYKLNVEDFSIEDKLVISKPLQAGYGAFRGLSLAETEEPGTYYGIYRTKDSVQNKSMFGVARINLYEKTISEFELGPSLRVSHLAMSRDGKRGYAGLNDIVSFDMENKKILNRKEDFERGRTNQSFIVSHDGSKLYVSGVGDTMYIYDAETFEPIKRVFAGGDFMMPPVELKVRPAVSSSSGSP